MHVVEPALTLVPGHEDAYYTMTVPSEDAPGAGDEVIDFTGNFTALAGAGLSMEVLDSTGAVLASGEHIRLRAGQGQVLTIHVFGLPAGDGARGSGAYTLDIDALPQVVSVEAQPLLPGGPVASLVLTFQGERLDQSAAADPANYRVTWIGPDGKAGTADDRVIALAAGGDRPAITPALLRQVELRLVPARTAAGGSALPPLLAIFLDPVSFDVALIEHEQAFTDPSLRARPEFRALLNKD